MATTRKPIKTERKKDRGQVYFLNKHLFIEEYYVIKKTKVGDDNVTKMISAFSKKSKIKIVIRFISLPRFTLFKKEDFDTIKKSELEVKVKKRFILSSRENALSDEETNKLVYDIENYSSQKRGNYEERESGIKKIKTNPGYMKHQQSESYRQYSKNKDKNKPKKGEKKPNKSKIQIQSNKSLILQPFAYKGNSRNSLLEIKEHLDKSKVFKEATVVKDATCGSGVISFYLADLYPEKSYILTDKSPYVIGMLNYIKNTSFEIIEKFYSEYYHYVFDEKNKDKQKENYISLIQKYNQMIKDEMINGKVIKKENPDQNNAYCLLIFLQNYSYTNVTFLYGGEIKADFKREKTAKKEYWLENMKACQSLMGKCSFKIEQMDVNNAIEKAKDKDFYIFTPPHESKANSDLYEDIIYSHTLSEIIKKKNIDFLMTYGHDSRQKSDEKTEEGYFIKDDDVLCMPYLIKGKMSDGLKIISIYTSSNAIESDKILKLHEYFHTAAQKNKKRLQKQRDEFLENESQITKEGLNYKKGMEDLSNQLELVDNVLNFLGKSKAFFSEERISPEVPPPIGSSDSIPTIPPVTPSKSPIYTPQNFGVTLFGSEFNGLLTESKSLVSNSLIVKK